MNTPLHILKKYWNYNEFRTPQQTIINNVLDGKDTLVLLPTGGGKSLCYQVPAMILEGVCIVISPLIALIQDQVNSLKEKNIKAIALTSQLTQEEVIVAFDNLQFGGYKFLYLSPEKLQSSFVQEKIKQLQVSLFAIDEAHCISEWGHDFRPSYLQLKVLKKLHPKTPFIALTATATKRVLEDIQLQLEIPNATVFKKSFQRKNLSYSVLFTEDIYGKLLQILKKLSGSSIIYTNSRKQTKTISNLLQINKFKSSFYHGGLSFLEKNEAFSKWMNDETPIMVATNAFGMGIDKPNVRAVIHINIPNSLENFIQEAGRAGRDREKAYSILLTNNTQLFETTSKFESTIASVKFVKKVYSHLNQYYKVALGETPTTPFNFTLQEFCHTYQLNLLQTYNAIKILEKESILILDENYSKRSTLKFIISSKQLIHYINEHPVKGELIKLILRSYGGISEHHTIINEFNLAKKLTINKSDVVNHLNDLNSYGIVEYLFEDNSSKLLFLVAREDDYTINSISKSIQKRNQVKFDKLNATIAYIRNIKTCRNIQLLAYFDETSSTPCGQCDVCKTKTTKPSSVKDIIQEIIELLKHHPLSSKELVTQLKYSETEVLNSLKILLEKNKITITSQNKFKSNF
ncbi:ATP-dependent DNA helicase RecQ [uncultured Lutibacter sp.]|uniref:RecQ family ATP-dependent DNA helicase n=1 Tax=uncultured Lutibacter sp. TaxID=437739 RepID=UPI00260FE625|nr:ATP-dependent DNA helicase RecQ [uncultured Lutibacter sp.]